MRVEKKKRDLINGVLGDVAKWGEHFVLGSGGVEDRVIRLRFEDVRFYLCYLMERLGLVVLSFQTYNNMVCAPSDDPGGVGDTDLELKSLDRCDEHLTQLIGQAIRVMCIVRRRRQLIEERRTQ